MSAGWDNTVLFWDLRTGKSTGYIYGPYTYGDSLDFRDDLILTGSWRGEK